MRKPRTTSRQRRLETAGRWKKRFDRQSKLRAKRIRNEKRIAWLTARALVRTQFDEAELRRLIELYEPTEEPAGTGA